MDDVRWDADLGLTAPTATGEMILLPRLWGMIPQTLTHDQVVLGGAGITVAVLMSSASLSIALDQVAPDRAAAA